MELLKWMFDLTYCVYGGSHFVLDSGPIGLGATGEIGIICMKDFQLGAFKGYSGTFSLPSFISGICSSYLHGIPP